MTWHHCGNACAAQPPDLFNDAGGHLAKGAMKRQSSMNTYLNVFFVPP